MSTKSLKDLDKGHPFYSDEANRARQNRIKELIREEEEIARQNRKAYYDRQKKEKGK